MDLETSAPSEESPDSSISKVVPLSISIESETPGNTDNPVIEPQEMDTASKQSSSAPEPSIDYGHTENSVGSADFGSSLLAEDVDIDETSTISDKQSDLDSAPPLTDSREAVSTDSMEATSAAPSDIDDKIENTIVDSVDIVQEAQETASGSIQPDPAPEQIVDSELTEESVDSVDLNSHLPTETSAMDETTAISNTQSDLNQEPTLLDADDSVSDDSSEIKSTEHKNPVEGSISKENTILDDTAEY